MTDKMSQSCLILLAHGSRDPRWRKPFETLCAEAARVREVPTFVKLAYMEFAEPSLMETVENESREGCTSFKILPLFMAAGAHVANDIPAQAAQLRERFPKVTIEILPPVGEDERVIAAIHAVIQDALGS